METMACVLLAEPCTVTGSQDLYRMNSEPDKMTSEPADEGEDVHDRRSGIRLWQEAKSKIPGGSQLLSKRSEMFAPGQWPSYYSSASGVEVVDLDGNTYVDMSIMGVGACVLGYSDDDVNRQVHQVVDSGSMCTLNPPEEVELADRLLEIHPWADMVRYGRTGGEAMSIAIRLARASTGEDPIAFCGYHGWHDWYLAANLDTTEHLEGHLLPGLDPKGVPSGLEGTALPFHYNEFEELKEIAQETDLGAIVVEPIRYHGPRDDFLENIRMLADELEVPLIFDEITAGFRTTVGGAHEQFGVTPDVVVYGKAIGNGYPMAAIVGTENVMDEAQESFVSSTFWTERIGPVAALATIEKLSREEVPDHLRRIGTSIMDGWERLADENGLDLNIKTRDIPALATFEFAYDDIGQAAKTLFTQEMLKRGYLASTSVYVSYSHTSDHVSEYLDAVDQTFARIGSNVSEGTVEDALEGPVAHSKFERLN